MAGRPSRGSATHSSQPKMKGGGKGGMRDPVKRCRSTLAHCPACRPQDRVGQPCGGSELRGAPPEHAWRTHQALVEHPWSIHGAPMEHPSSTWRRASTAGRFRSAVLARGAPARADRGDHGFKALLRGPVAPARARSWRSWAMLGDPGRCRAKLDDAGRSWAMLASALPRRRGGTGCKRRLRRHSRSGVARGHRGAGVDVSGAAPACALQP